jgi:hypothetical protein
MSLRFRDRPATPHEVLCEAKFQTGPNSWSVTLLVWRFQYRINGADRGQLQRRMACSLTVSISYKMTPRENRSLRESTVVPRTCLGCEYPATSASSWSSASGAVAAFARGEEHRDVRMIQRRGDARVVEKAGAPRGTEDQLRRPMRAWPGPQAHTPALRRTGSRLSILCQWKTNGPTLVVRIDP